MKPHPATTEAQPTDWHAAIVENLVDGVIVIDTDGIIRYVNPAAHQLAGNDPAVAPGEIAADALTLMDPEERTVIDLPSIQSFQAHRKKTNSIIYTHVIFASKRQPECIVNAVFTPILQPQGPTRGIILRFRDVTQSVEEERKVRDKQKIEAISTMAASIASEFTNWLGLISGHAAAIMDNLIPRTRAYEEAVSILDATNRAGGLTKRLLSVARAGHKKLAIKPEPVDLNAIIRSAVNQARSLFAPNNVEIKVKHHNHLPMVLADATQLFDCLMNLFRNAADAMPEGGRITVDFPSASHSLPHREFVLIRVRDTGHGIEKSVMERVFDPFFTTKNPTSAIGLGLTVVQTSVEQWGGMVRIRSRPNQGTSVRIFLRPASNGDLQASAEQRRTQGGAGQILVVDDQAEQLNEICASLSAAGYQMHRTRGADEFLAFYRKHTDEIDLVIIDVVMPGKDGKYVLDRLLRVNPQARVIMTSGFSRDYVRNYLKRGAWGFIQKPIDREHLVFTVQRILTTAEAS